TSPYQDLHTILSNSLNVGAASIALKIGRKTYSEMIAKLGFYDKTGIDLPGESGSYIPDANQWKDVQLATIGFGQGISVTPIQMAAAYCMLANDGHPIRPHLLKSVSRSGEHGVQEAFVPVLRSLEEKPRLKPQTSDILKYLFSEVVKRGTGTGAAVPG